MTEAQTEVYDALLGAEAANGYWPVPVREVARLAGRGIDTTFQHLRRLERDGHVERGPYPGSGFRVAA